MISRNQAWIAAISFGMASGLPSEMIGNTFQARLSDAGLDASKIGMIGLAGMPLMLKPLWAPAVDRIVPPLGRRRGWILAAAIFLFFGLGMIGTIDPRSSLGILVACLVLTTFFSATLDIAVNGWTCDMIAGNSSSGMAGWSVWGFRVAALLSSSVALAMAGRLGWTNTYWLVAGLLLVVVMVGERHPEPSSSLHGPVSLKEAVVTPFRQFWEDFGAYGMLVLFSFALLFRLADSWAANQSTNFLNLSYVKDQLAVAKAVALVAVALGVGAAAVAERKLTKRSLLLLAGVLGAVSNLGFLFVLNPLLKGLPGLYAALLLESLCGGFLSAVFVGFLMSRCRSSSSATQYAILTSIWLLGRFLTAPTGQIVKDHGWATFFVASALAGIPGILLVFAVVDSRAGKSLATAPPGRS